jgi:hypothetical protein
LDAISAQLLPTPPTNIWNSNLAKKCSANTTALHDDFAYIARKHFDLIETWPRLLGQGLLRFRATPSRFAHNTSVQEANSTGLLWLALAGPDWLWLAAASSGMLGLLAHTFSCLL